jgi:hypothetical protein
MISSHNSTENKSNAIQLSLCHYKNASDKLQILRIGNIPNWYFERVIFPGELLLFQAPLQGVLEIHNSSKVTTIVADTIKCDRLRVEEEFCLTEDTISSPK